MCHQEPLSHPKSRAHAVSGPLPFSPKSGLLVYNDLRVCFQLSCRFEQVRRPFNSDVICLHLQREVLYDYVGVI